MFHVVVPSSWSLIDSGMGEGRRKKEIMGENTRRATTKKTKGKCRTTQHVDTNWVARAKRGRKGRKREPKEENNSVSPLPSNQDLTADPLEDLKPDLTPPDMTSAQDWTLPTPTASLTMTSLYKPFRPHRATPPSRPGLAHHNRVRRERYLAPD